MTSIYVGNLSRALTEDELRSMFSPFGEVASAAIVRYRETGRSRGFGFVEMADAQAAAAAIRQLDRQEVAGRAVSVALAQSHGWRPRRSDSPW